MLTGEAFLFLAETVDPDGLEAEMGDPQTSQALEEKKRISLASVLSCSTASW